MTGYLKCLPIMAGLAGAFVSLASPLYAQETPKRGGMLRHVVDQEGGTYDCHATGTSFSLQVLAPHYSTLLKFSHDNYPEIVGDLAESWELSSDRLTYTFKLRQGVKFHDGSTFDSADMLATWERMKSPPEGITSVRQGQFAAIEAMSAPDPQTFVVTMKKPDPAATALFASPWNCVYSAEDLAKDPNFPARNVNGTGPYIFVENVKGSHWEARRNDNYWDAGKPYLDRLRAEFINGAGAINALAGNQVDAALFQVAPAERGKLSSLNPDLVFQTAANNITVFLTPNTLKPPFDNVKVRQALNLAISRVEGNLVLPTISPLKGTALYMPTNSIAQRTDEELLAMPGMSADVQAQRESAKKLFEEAGAAGLKITLLNRNLRQPWEPLGLFVLDQWRKAGLQADQIAAETPQYFAALQSKNFDVAIDFNNTVSVDPSEALVKFMPGSANNYSGIDDPKLTEMFQAQLDAGDDEAERARITRDIEAYMLDNAYFIPLFRTSRLVAHHKDVKGWKLPPTTTLNLQMDTVWLDR